MVLSFDKRLKIYDNFLVLIIVKFYLLFDVVWV